MDGTQNQSVVPRPALSPKQKQRSSSDTASTGGGLLGNLKIWQKLALIIVLALAPILYLLYAFFTAQNEQLQFAAKEQDGAKYLTVAARLLKDIPLHRSLASVVLAGDASYAQQRDQTAAAIQQDFKGLNEVDRTYSGPFQITGRVAKLQQSWGQLVARANTLSPEVSFDQHTKIIDEQLKPLMRDVATNSNLILDPDLEAYTAVDLVVNNLLTFTEYIDRLNGLGTTIFLRKKVTSQQRFDVAYYQKRTDDLDATMFASIETIFKKYPNIGAQLKADNDAGQVPADRMRELVRTKIIAANAINYDHRDFFRTGSQAVEAHVSLLNKSLLGLQGILQERIDGLRRAQLISAAVTGLALLLLALFTTLIVLAITRPVSSMVRVVEKFGRGDLSETVNVRSSDELGLLAGSFNQSIMRLRGLVSTEAERDEERNKREELQRNIGDFLNVTMDISHGNLTKKGKVTEDVLGNVVDAINVMTEEIGYLLKDVERVAQQVNDGSNEVSTTNEAILQGAQTQTEIAQKARTQALEVTQSIRAMAQKALETAQASQQTLAASQQGQTALQETLSGMQNIRREVQGISKSIKSLSDRSLEISEITETISGIAAQTNMLALNAAIEASGAGEAGARFGIVADEVRKLAEDSARATGRVTNLIKNIQNEVQSVVIGVEGGTREVEQGYKIASQAGERLKEISQLANQSAALVQTISSAARAQAGSVEQVKNAVEAITQSAGQTEAHSTQGRQSAAALRKLSAELTSSLSRFQLPS